MRVASVVVCLVSMSAFAQQAGTTATANLTDAQGKSIGSVQLEQTLSNGVLLKGDLHGLPAGDHAIHFHQVGKCEAPFKTAGDHFNPMKKEHGFMSKKGHHAGDLPNISVPDSGNVKFELITDMVSLKSGKTSVFDKDGTAIVIHAKADDYQSQPAGAAGDRIACGVIEKGGGMSGSTGKGEPTGTSGMGGMDGGTMPHQMDGGTMTHPMDGGMMPHDAGMHGGNMKH